MTGQAREEEEEECLSRIVLFVLSFEKIVYNGIFHLNYSVIEVVNKHLSF